MSSVAVIGGGIVGRSCALRIAQAGHQVILLDFGDKSAAASWGNAGHIATEQVAPLASVSTVRSLPRRLFLNGGPVSLPLPMIGHWAPFALRLIAASTPRRFASGRSALAELLGQAVPAWQRLVRDIGDPSLLRIDGHYCAWESRARARAGREAWQSAGTGSSTMRDATSQEVEKLRTLSPRVEAATKFEGTGQVADLDTLADSLNRTLQSVGVHTERMKAALVIDGKGRARIAGIESEIVVVAAGIGSAALMRSAGHIVPLIAERGYHLRSRDFQWQDDLSPVVFEEHSLIATRFRNCIQLSGFVEFASADALPDHRKWERLEQHSAQLQLPIRAPFDRWFGSRPTFPDYLPAIGRSGRAPNLYYAFGHQHLGLTLGPLTGELIAHLVEQDEPLIDLTRLAVERFV